MRGHRLALAVVALACVACAPPPPGATPTNPASPTGTPTTSATPTVSPTVTTEPTEAPTSVPGSTPTPTTPQQNSQPPVNDVTVTILRGVSAGSQLQVAAIVDGVVEDGGTCEMRATKGGVVVSTAGGAEADAQSTVCEPLTSSQVSPGTWSVTVAYDSPRHHGVSAAIEIEVP